MSRIAPYRRPLLAAAACLAAIAAAASHAQPAGTARPVAADLGLPTEPTAVPLPRLSEEITGPGPMFDSAPSQAPGLGPQDFAYATREYFVSGTADGRPYTTRVVVRMPRDPSRFSGLVLAESMHYSGAAHAFEFTAAYTMDSGHTAVEILTTTPAPLKSFNAERYSRLVVEDGQANDILAQVGALIKSDRGPLGNVTVRKMVLAGTSMSSATLFNYLPAHAVYRTPDMKHIYDGYFPTSTAATAPEIDVPIIQMPTMHEVEGNISRRQDSDEPGRQFRMYEVAGIGHVDSRDNVRLIPNPCTKPLSMFPLQAYMSVGLHHLFRWIDEGITPPRAARILTDRDTHNDGSMMALDEHGNPLGGVRNPYVDVPVAKYAPFNTAREPLIENAAEWIIANGGIEGARIMCRLSAYQEPFSREKLRELYGDKHAYLRRVEERLDELEREGWSLPLYRELILRDAAAVEF